MEIFSLDKETLHTKYVIERKTIGQIAKEVDCSVKGIRNYVEKYGLNVKNYNNREILNRKYWVEIKSQSRIADELDCDPHTIHRNMAKHKIPFRTMSECQLAPKWRDNNPTFFGSSSI